MFRVFNNAQTEPTKRVAQPISQGLGPTQTIQRCRRYFLCVTKTDLLILKQPSAAYSVAVEPTTAIVVRLVSESQTKTLSILYKDSPVTACSCLSFLLTTKIQFFLWDHIGKFHNCPTSSPIIIMLQDYNVFWLLARMNIILCTYILWNPQQYMHMQFSNVRQSKQNVMDSTVWLQWMMKRRESGINRPSSIRNVQGVLYHRLITYD